MEYREEEVHYMRIGEDAGSVRPISPTDLLNEDDPAMLALDAMIKGKHRLYYYNGREV